MDATLQPATCTAQAAVVAADDTKLVRLLSLPSEVRDEIGRWESALASVGEPVVAALKVVALRFGVSPQTAIRKYYAWQNSGRDPLSLVNRTKAGLSMRDGGLSADFLEWWKGLQLQNGRKCLPAYREFRRLFLAGELIPGIDPALPRTHIPPGYSQDNLRKHTPTEFERAASRIGRGAAADFRPKIITTRVGLHVGERIIFDDMWHDFKVVMLGQRRPMRLLQLHAHDLFSACQFARGIKPRMIQEDGSAVNLTEDEMTLLVAHVLHSWGYFRDGCTLMVEHGTAAISEQIERLLFDVTGGKVRVERSGIGGDPAFAGQYAGRSKGNFRFKAALESLGNLIHNETANLIQFPGQTGSNSRTNLPEELHGRERHADALSLAIVALPDEVRMKLRMPFLEVNAAKRLVDEVMERINGRTDHDLQGWVDAGLTAVDFEVPGLGIIPAGKLLGLPADKRAAIEALGSPICRKLSPREVFDAGRSGLVRFTPAQTAAILAESRGREVAVGRDHMLSFDDAGISAETLIYRAHQWSPGTKFRVVVNPFAPDTAHLFDAAGRWVGVTDAFQRVSHTDTEALHRAMGEMAHIEKQMLAPVARAGAALTRQRLEAAQNNVAVLSAAQPVEAPAPVESGRDNTDEILARSEAVPEVEFD